MPQKFAQVTKQNPCPVCGKPDYCQLGHSKIKCMRVASDFPVDRHDPGKGHYHLYSGDVKPTSLPKAAHRPSSINFSDLHKTYEVTTTLMQRQLLATNLGVLLESIVALRGAWAKFHSAWSFPMRDEQCNIIGLRLRNNDGAKWTVKGSRNGLFIPMIEFGSEIAVVEGPTSTAAMLSMGFSVIGKPSCSSGDELVIEFLKLRGIKRVICVADNDEKKITLPNGAEKVITPGLDGAQNLQKRIGGVARTVVWTPQAKDVRKALQLGITKQVIESAIKDQVWR